MTANRKQSTTTTEAPVETTPVADTSIDTRASESHDELERLQSEQKATAARIKELNAAKKAAHSEPAFAPSNAVKALSARAEKLIKGGMDREAAVAKVLDLTRAAINARLNAAKSEAE